MSDAHRTPRAGFKPRTALVLCSFLTGFLSLVAHAQTPGPVGNVQIVRHAGKIDVSWTAPTNTPNAVYHVTYKPNLNSDPRSDEKIGQTDLAKHEKWQLGATAQSCCSITIEGVPYFWGVIAGVRAMKNNVGGQWRNSHYSPQQNAPPPVSVSHSNKDAEYVDLTITPADTSGFDGFSVVYYARRLRSDGWHNLGWEFTRSPITIPIDSGVEGAGIAMNYLDPARNGYDITTSDYVDTVWGPTVTGVQKAQAPTNVTLVRGDGHATVSWQHPTYVGPTLL